MSSAVQGVLYYLLVNFCIRDLRRGWERLPDAKAIRVLKRSSLALEWPGTGIL